MCFSATASFTAFGVMSVAGTLTSLRARSLGLPLGQRALAAVPLVFGIQQGIEAFVWLGISGQVPQSVAQIATVGFLFFAVSFWPIAGPVLGYLNEAKPVRKRIFAVLILLGIAVAIYLFTKAITPVVPAVAEEALGSHLRYMKGVKLLPYMEYIYFVVAVSALLLSTNRPAFHFGLVLTVSFVATMALYHLYVLTSVWCFFAAFCSLIIAWDLWRLPHRQALRTV